VGWFGGDYLSWETYCEEKFLIIVGGYRAEVFDAVIASVGYYRDGAAVIHFYLPGGNNGPDGCSFP
jgi:hypothetical protein